MQTFDLSARGTWSLPQSNEAQASRQLPSDYFDKLVVTWRAQKLREERRAHMGASLLVCLP